MPTGIVKSYSSQKSYGFIRGEDGQSFFFHISQVLPESKRRISSGCVVSFDEKPTPKGMAAENVEVKGEAVEAFEDIPEGEIIVSKSDACGRGNRVVHKLARVCVEDRDPNAAMALLKHKAREAGCNAVVNLQRDRRTGEAWTTRYKYTIHVMSAEPAIVKRVVKTTDMEKAEHSRRAVESEISDVSDVKLEDAPVWDAGGIKMVFNIVAFIAAAIFFVSYVR